MHTSPALEARHAGHLRALNLERILTVAMDRAAPLTRQALAEATSLSAPTISTLAADLMRRGLLRDVGTAPSRGGRRATLVEFDAGYGLVLGLDVGGVESRVALADLSGHILARSTVPTTPSSPLPHDVLDGVAKAARALLDEPGVPRSSLLAIVAAAPGAVDHGRGVVFALAPGLEGWEQVPMADVLADLLRAPVVVDNDVNLAVVGERARGVARGHDTCAFVSAGAGIGAGIVVGGQLHRGHHSLAGEIGLMCPGAEYTEREFGTHGALESMAGTKALERLWAGAPKERVDAWIQDLFAAARGGEPAARHAVREVGTLLGLAATNLALVLDPSLIVFGGPLLAPDSPLLDETRRIVRRIIPKPPELVPSALGPEATLLGCVVTAAHAARDRVREILRSRGA
jgi:predicted NBD/HSP70 family sugar kinase